MKQRVYQTKTNPLVKLWNKFLKFVRGLCITATFLLIPVTIGGIVYFSFICYDLPRALLMCAVLLVVLYANMKL